MQRCTHRASCKRAGRLHHECLVEGCGHVIHACSIHAAAARRVLEQHVMTAHPVEYERLASAASAEPVEYEQPSAFQSNDYLAPINPVKS